MSIITGTLTVQSVEGDTSLTDLELVIEKGTAPGAVGDSVKVQESFTPYGYTFVSFHADPGNPQGTIEEIVGDPDTDHVLIVTDTDNAPSLAVGSTYDTITLGSTLVALVPGA